MTYKEITLKMNMSPFIADELLQNFGVLMEGGGKGVDSSYVKDKEGNYKARCLGDLNFVQFAMANQGYMIELIENK